MNYKITAHHICILVMYFRNPLHHKGTTFYHLIRKDDIDYWIAHVKIQMNSRGLRYAGRSWVHESHEGLPLI